MKTKTIVKICLFGKTGCGLSATGNAILGKRVFKSVYNPSQPTTKKVSSDYKEHKNIQLKVVDGSTVSSHELVKDKEMTFTSKNVEQDMSLRSFDTILFVMRFGDRFSGEEEKILENLENIFGKKVYDKMIVVMTGGEQFTYAMEEEGGFTNFQEWCSQQGGRFQKLYQACGRRVVLLDNRNKTGNKRKQTREIVNLVVKLKVTHESLKEPARTELKAKFYFSGKGSGIFVSKRHQWNITSSLGMACLLLMIECCHSAPTMRHLCHPGTYVHTTRNNQNICQLCPNGTFMPYHFHSNKTCYNCTQIQDQNLEVLKTECSRTHDAEILCIPGYYRRRARNVREVDRCEKCYECEHPTLPCQDYHDTVCCGHTNYDAVLNKDGVYECKERPILCDPGQFLNQETEECTPCPPGTFMPEVQHDNKVCRICKSVADLNEHEIIDHVCNSTHDSQTICLKEFFMQTKKGLLWDEVLCLPCQKCEYQGRECGMYHDTVCCDHPDMIVVKNSSGYHCMDPSTTTSSTSTSTFLQKEDIKERYPQVCGENEYSYFISEDSILCVPCERGTYMDKNNHTERVCKNCSQIQGSHASSICQDLAEDGDKAETSMLLNVMISVIAVLLVVIGGMGFCICRLRRKTKLSEIAVNKDKPMRNSGGNRISLSGKLSNSQELSENTKMMCISNE